MTVSIPIFMYTYKYVYIVVCYQFPFFLLFCFSPFSLLFFPICFALFSPSPHAFVTFRFFVSCFPFPFVLCGPFLDCVLPFCFLCSRLLTFPRSDYPHSFSHLPYYGACIFCFTVPFFGSLIFFLLLFCSICVGGGPAWRAEFLLRIFFVFYLFLFLLFFPWVFLASRCFFLCVCWGVLSIQFIVFVFFFFSIFRLISGFSEHPVFFVFVPPPQS